MLWLLRSDGSLRRGLLSFWKWNSIWATNLGRVRVTMTAAILLHNLQVRVFLGGFPDTPRPHVRLEVFHVIMPQQRQRKNAGHACGAPRPSIRWDHHRRHLRTINGIDGRFGSFSKSPSNRRLKIRISRLRLLGGGSKMQLSTPFAGSRVLLSDHEPHSGLKALFIPVRHSFCIYFLSATRCFPTSLAQQVKDHFCQADPPRSDLQAARTLSSSAGPGSIAAGDYNHRGPLGPTVLRA